MKTCPHCKNVVMLYSGMYRCRNCSVWLYPEEVVSDMPHRPTVSESADASPLEVRKVSTKDCIFDELSE
jgi:hypothetical protein